MKYPAKEILLKDGKKCILRSPELADAQDMIDFLRQTSGETDFLVRYPEEVTLTLETECELLQRMLVDDKSVMIAAFVEGELAGNLGLNNISSRLKLCHRVSLGIAFKQKYWGLGLGNTLMDEAIRMAGEMGYEQIELGAFADNERALALYRKKGFEVWGTIKHAFKLKDGTYHDELQMGKIL